LQAIKLIVELELNKVIFELNTKIVVDNFNNLSQNLSFYNIIIRDCFFTNQYGSS